MSEIRTRFAPSPTGKLHLGGAHTALYCWLYARRHGGSFILRVEDTDKERSTKENVQVILDGMTWMGLDWDEGPIFQSDRTERYVSAINHCLENAHAYRCTCRSEDLEAKRENARAQKQTYLYDGTCRDKNYGPDCGPHVVRFKMPNEGYTELDDLIKGTVRYPNSELDDWIIARTDGSPTYNFCVVVDDAEMKISHVLRGDDHLTNTPKQIHVYKALGYEVPQFAHMPLMHGMGGGKLSKRHGATSVTDYRDMGYLPIAVRNYLARLGWAHGDQEIFNDDELIKYFDIKDIGKSPSIFDTDKFLWVNSQHMRNIPFPELAKMVLPFMKERGFDDDEGPWLTRLVELYVDRADTLADIAEKSMFLYHDEIEIEESAAQKHLRPVALEPMVAIREALENVDPFDEENLQRIFEATCEKLELKLGKLAQPVRVAVTGGSASPGIFETLELIGKERTLARIEKGIEFIKERASRQE